MTGGRVKHRSDDDSDYPVFYGLGSLHTLTEQPRPKGKPKPNRIKMGFHIPPRPKGGK